MSVRTLRLVFLISGGVLLSTSCQRSAPSPASYSARIGVAISLPDRICMAIHNPKLLPATTITLIAPADALKNHPVASARAQVRTNNAEACPGTRTDAAIDSYNLILTTGKVDPNLPLVALEARVPSVLAAHSFHACNTNDGLELTAWDGAKPLEGHRLWRQHYTLGDKLEANCTAAETAPY